MLSIDPRLASQLRQRLVPPSCQPPDSAANTDALIGLPRLMQRAFDGEDLSPLGSQLIARSQANPDDANALLDLSIVLQLIGNRPLGLRVQAEALAMRQLYHLAPASGRTRLRLLALMAPGDLSANTPLEFLLQDQDVALDMLYLAPGLPMPEHLPDHDVLFVAACESSEGRATLELMQALVGQWPRPVVNRPENIVWVDRCRASGLLGDVAGVDMPRTIRATRGTLEAMIRGGLDAADLLGDGDFPLIIRPLDSHAGHGLALLTSLNELRPYLQQQPEDEFHLSRFVDYRSPDDWYRKYRVVMIEAQAYPVHMAISRHWMIHYLNADMAGNAANRAEEGQWMAAFDQEFGQRHRAAFAEIRERLGLDYLCLDCAETPDGRLLIFEVDSGAVVHAMDPEDLFPYKKPAMQRIFAAFTRLLKNRRSAAQRGLLP